MLPAWHDETAALQWMADILASVAQRNGRGRRVSDPLAQAGERPAQRLHPRPPRPSEHPQGLFTDERELGHHCDANSQARQDKPAATQGRDSPKEPVPAETRPGARANPRLILIAGFSGRKETSP